MTAITVPLRFPSLTPRRHIPRVHLLGLGTAVPEIHWLQEEMERKLATLWRLEGVALEKWRRIVAGSGIEHRHGVMQPEDAIGLTTAQRMLAYERLAPPLAERAASRAMERAGVSAGDVTDVVVVSCTGFAAPGLDVTLIERLGLNASTRRTTVGFMGCFGALNGLRVANGLCAADPDAVVLLVCAELCSLHVRDDVEPQNQVACALFADGAAAAVLSTKPYVDIGDRREASDQAPRSIGVIGRGASRLLSEGREWMTWRITDTGFAMTLTREVPVALRRCVAEFVQESFEELAESAGANCIVHPGGPGVLDAVDVALDLRGGRGLECSRRVLRKCGNMSSATVLFVLENALRSGLAAPFNLLAFGPGLTIEGLTIHASPRASA